MSSLPASSSQLLSPGGGYVGEVAYIFAYDIAYEMPRQVTGTLLGQPIRHFDFDPRQHHAPRKALFYRPDMIRLPAQVCQGPHGPVEVRRTVKLYPVGAISITLHVPISVQSVPDLACYHELKLDGQPVHGLAYSLAQEILEELRPWLDRPAEALADEGAYVVFCLASDGPDGGPLRQASQWLADHRLDVAGLLNQEPDYRRLSSEEIEDAVANYQSYYAHDLVVMDWDAALIINEERAFGDVLHAMELANVQLVELEVYDRLLDTSLQGAYRDMRQRLKVRAKVSDSLREIRVDLARLTDELSNVGKFFGDWHMAKVYQRIAGLLHLEDWRRTIDDKLMTLDSLYQILKQDQVNRLLVYLEFSVVIIFLIDLVLVFAGLLINLK